jgi:hypothetical protein
MGIVYPVWLSYFFLIVSLGRGAGAPPAAAADATA